MTGGRLRGAAIAAGVALAVGGGLGTTWAAFSATSSNAGNNFTTASDGSPPTVSRAVAAKSSGATPGTIRQGGDYYAYAQVTDDATGVSSVTANASAFDAGVTSAALSSGGGPWTIGGQSYNYRSSLLTADTPLNTGSSYTYSIAATDGASNSTTQNFTVTIETYSSVITGTSGLVSYWRMGDGALSGDEFSDSAATVLANHQGSLGARWTAFAGEARTAVISDANRVRKETGNGAAMYHASGTPSSANYLVEADLHVKSLLASDAAGVLGRLDTAPANGTYYLARYVVDSGNWQLLRVTNGSATSLGTYAQTLNSGSTYRVTLQMNGSTIRVLIDGTQRISVTDTNITATGRGGIRLGAGGSTAQVTNTAGLHLDDFRISDLTTTAADSRGTNNGTYTNGPRLNQPGALVGDSNRAALFDGSNDYARVPDAASLDLGDGPLTFEAWVKRNDTPTGEHNILHKGSTGPQWAFNSTDHRLIKDGSGSIANAAGAGSDTSGYHHWVATKSGTTTKLYRDGVDITPGTTGTQTLSNTANALILGADGAGTGEFLNARLDEVAIYNQVLSAATVLDHYKAGAGTG